MDNFMKMLNVQSVLFLYIVAGIICRKRNIFTDEVQNRLTDFVMAITLPCMIFESFKMDFSLEILKRSMTALSIAASMAVLAYVCGKALYRNYPENEKSVMQYGTLVTNSGFAGLPIISGMYGHAGLLLASFFIIPTRILMWSAGVALFAGTGSKGALRRVALHPAVVAVYLGLIRMVFQIPMPAFADTALNSMGACTSPLAMALVGSILADTNVKSLFEPKAFFLVLVRQIILPAVCLVGLKLLGVEELTLGISVILSGMPIGSSTAILAQKYGADAIFASKCVVISTATSLITVSVLTLFI